MTVCIYHGGLAEARRLSESHHRLNPIIPVSLGRTEAAYIAGLIDGEGYIGIGVARGSKSARECSGAGSYRLSVSVRMTDAAPIRFIEAATALGKVRGPIAARGRGTRPCWEWTAWSRQASALLAGIYEHLIVKRPQAELAMVFQSVMRFPGTAGLTDTEWQLRQWFQDSIQSHNYGPKGRAA